MYKPENGILNNKSIKQRNTDYIQIVESNILKLSDINNSIFKGSPKY